MTLDVITTEATMKVFVTGGSGWIGSAVVPELLGAGHEVAGLARSDASAQAVSAAGAEVVRGSLDDLDALRTGAEEADGVIHLAYIHDFARLEHSVAADEGAIRTFGDALAGSGRPLVIASGILGLAPGRVGTERDTPTTGSHREPAAALTLALAERDVRSAVVRLPPSVHGAGDHGFLATLVGIARETGVSAYVGDGGTRWSAVHRDDAARLFRLAVESAPAGSVLHGVADVGVPVRELAAVIGRHLGLPVEPRPSEHFGWLGRFLALDGAASSVLTRELLGWEPAGPGLLADLEAGHYF
jgi:nucleoside-diphosphate-sugar epimerase